MGSIETLLQKSWRIIKDVLSGSGETEIEEAEWIKNIRKAVLRSRLQYKINEDAKRFLIFSPVPWPTGNMERMLSIALQARGYKVDEIYCGGGFPACGMEHSRSQRPSCDHCKNHAEYWFELWKLKAEATSAFQEEDSWSEAQKYVDQLPWHEYTDMIYKNFISLKYDGFPLGIRVYQQTHWYFSCNFSDSEAVIDYLKKCAVAYIVGIKIAEKVLDRREYEAIIVANGKTIEGSPVIDVAVARGVRYITWEELIVFDHNSPIVEFAQPGVWEAVKEQSLTQAQRQQVDTFFSLWRESKNTGWVYYENPIEDIETVKRNLKLRADSFKIVLFPNLLLDSSIIGMHVGFESIFDWIFTCVEYALNNPDVDLVIRCHPAEKFDLDFLRSQVFVTEEITKKYGRVPANIIMIESDSKISSYALMKIADIPMTYTGTLSLEAPFYNKMCLIGGKSNLRGKGFTIDIDTKEEMLEYFERRQPLRPPSEAEKEYAYRYGYLYKVRTENHPKFYDKRSRHFDIKTLEMLEPGKDVFWDNLCESVVEQYAFIDMEVKGRTPVDLKQQA